MNPYVLLFVWVESTKLLALVTFEVSMIFLDVTDIKRQPFSRWWHFWVTTTFLGVSDILGDDDI